MLKLLSSHLIRVFLSWKKRRRDPMKKFVVIDVETTGHSPAKGDKIIEIGIVVIENDQIVKQYNQLINPKSGIPPFITQLTSISEEQIRDKPSFSEVADDLIPLLADAIMVAHNINFDLSFLNDELTQAGLATLQPPIIDTVELSRIFFPRAPGYKLGELAQHLHLTHDQPHRAISDALVTADLLLLLMNKINSLPIQVINQLLDISVKLKSDLAILLPDEKEAAIRHDLCNYNGLAIKNWQEYQKPEAEKYALSFQDCLDRFYGENGYLQKKFQEYERRKDQQWISETIYDQFQRNRHAMIEAETGIGKSIAYLLPAVYQSIHSKEPVVISTSNTNLQAKLKDEDMHKVFSFFSQELQVTLVKGKQNYLSIEKFFQFYQDRSQNSYHHLLIKAMILVWLTETTTGDLDEIQLPKKDQQMKQQLVVDKQDSSSPWSSACFYQRMKRKAKHSHIIITNHALLSLDIVSTDKLLPNYAYLILDEAHRLDTVASRYLGNSLNYFELSAFFQRLEKSLGEIDPLIKILKDTHYEIDSLFRLLFLFVKDNNNKNKTYNDRGRLQSLWDLESFDRDKTVIRDGVYRSIELLNLLSQQLLEAEANLIDRETYLLELREFSDKLKCLLLLSEESEVTWLEIDQNGAENAVYIYRELFSATEQLTNHLFTQKKGIIMISGTLTIQQSFAYMRKSFGLKEKEVDCYQLKANFPYDQNVQLMIPSDFPEIRYPQHDEFVFATSEAILSLAKLIKGKMLVLFTSYDMLKQTYYLLKETEDLEDYMIIGQGLSTGSRNRLIKHFRSFEQSILLGTNAFWEGIDIPGEDLSCLVIVKLPFQSPSDPVYTKKAEYYKKLNRNPFMELSLPKAVFQFKQGFGRLVRKQTDRGVIFVFDDRIMKKRYGKYFLESIPDVPLSYEPLHQLLKKVNI